MPLYSNYENGKYHDGVWRCGCDQRAIPFESSQPNSKGEKFLRCSQPRGQQCRFFLTEVDDTERIRRAKTLNVILTPETLTSPRSTDPRSNSSQSTSSQSSTIPATLPTPDTGKTTLKRRLFTSSGSSTSGDDSNGSSSRKRRRLLSLHDDSEHSPSPSSRQVRQRTDHHDKNDLPTLVFELLQSDGLALRSSTKSAIRHVILEREAASKARLHAKESLEMALEKIDELEGHDDSASSDDA
ncbi:GRF zinc finger domain-containing protein [Purpureocillium lilacinum]|uniref:GRF zinc finger domain-containing protein n=1 Tax=Purpureocillium lilacinum TaxID=33203 RepID=A0A179GN69_PURLI|nr:GRF zinc finger domain-containing protein [Purpureocillium lilacinum]OAQ79334.1 GRF zinc finger domain-containing protein [Purpureocillium lilacinum]